MAIQPQTEHPPKTLGESAVCFGCCAGIVLVVAMAFQWLLHLIP
jgi:hypothetical protein